MLIKRSEEIRKKREEPEAIQKIEDEDLMNDDDDDYDTISKVQTHSQLWIDKYSSLKFFDLLSDEVTNRNVLTWLKTWDEVIDPNKPKVNFKIPETMKA